MAVIGGNLAFGIQWRHFTTSRDSNVDVTSTTSFFVTGVGSEILICDSPHDPRTQRDSNYQLLNLFIDGWRILEASVRDNDRILDRSVLQVIASDFNKTCNITAIVFC